MRDGVFIRRNGVEGFEPCLLSDLIQQARPAACAESLAEIRALHDPADELTVWSEFCHGLLSANEFIYLK